MEIDVVHVNHETVNTSNSDCILHHSIFNLHSPPSQPSKVHGCESDPSVQSSNFNNDSVENSLTEDTNQPDEFEFVKNDLYEFLSSNREGQIILGKYKHKRILDEARLKDSVLLNKLFDDQRKWKWKINNATFLELRDQIIQLFPNQDPARIYILPIEGEYAQGPRGYLYNHYRILRKELREANLLKVQDHNDSDANSSFVNESVALGTNDYSCLTDPTRELYTTIQVTQKWQEIYDHRMNTLHKTEKRKKVVTLSQYFQSFPCLAPPLGILLLEQDFDSYIRALANKKPLPSALAVCFLKEA